MERETPDAVARLSPRQKECLRIVYRRRTSKEIAAELGLSPGTVDTYCAEAVATLDARNRREAAEILHLSESGAGDQTPSKVEPRPSGVTEAPSILPPIGHGNSPADWRQLLPFRRKGAAHNDLPILARLGWIPGLAILAAIAFGMLASGLQVISALFARAHG